VAAVLRRSLTPIDMIITIIIIPEFSAVDVNYVASCNESGEPSRVGRAMSYWDVCLLSRPEECESVYGFVQGVILRLTQSHHHWSTKNQKFRDKPFPGWSCQPHAQPPAILEGRCFLSGLSPLADYFQFKVSGSRLMPLQDLAV
jgi:hypothetical protein